MLKEVQEALLWYGRRVVTEIHVQMERSSPDPSQGAKEWNQRANAFNRSL